MRIKRKNGLKMIVIALVLLLCLALAVGITGAYYQAKRQATGTLNMDQGIVIDYNGFDKTTADDWATWTRGVTLPLFSTTNAQPGEHIAVNAAGIRANAKSVDFYARVKLSYKFYNNDTEVTLANASDLITTSANFFGTNWVDGGSSDGYYYYATGTTLNKFTKTGTTFVDLFATGAEFIIEGENFTGATSDGEGGGFKIDETTSINKIEVYLTLETLQGDADAAAEGWKIASPVKFAEATGKMETSVNKTTVTDEDLNVSVAGATEVPINKVVFPYDTDTTLKFDSNNVEYVTLTYEDGSSDTFEEVAEKTISVRADSSKGKVTGYVVGLWSDSEYTGFTYKNYNTYSGTTNNSGDDLVNYPVDGLVVAGYFGNETDITIPAKAKVRNRDFKLVISYTSWENWGEQLELYLLSIEYPCKIEGKNYSDLNALLEDACEGGYLSEKVKNGTFPNSMTITYNVLCETTSILYTAQNIKEIGMGLLASDILAEAERSSAIEKITISEGIEVIGSDAFRNCSSLTSVTIPNSVKIILDRAFSFCTSLSTIEIPDSVEYIGHYYANRLIANCFKDCNNLTTTIGDIGGTWVKASDNTAVATDTLLKDITYDIKRV